MQNTVKDYSPMSVPINFLGNPLDDSISLFNLAKYIATNKTVF